MSENENDLVSEIHAISDIEFPDDTFDKRTIKNQWRKYFENQKFHANVPGKIKEILKLTKAILYDYDTQPDLPYILKQIFDIEQLNCEDWRAQANANLEFIEIEQEGLGRETLSSPIP